MLLAAVAVVAVVAVVVTVITFIDHDRFGYQNCGLS